MPPDMTKTAHAFDIEESRTSYTGGGQFPEDLPPRPGPPPAATATWKQRTSRLWKLSLSSYSLVHTPDGAARVRHIVMILILGLRTAMSVLSVLSAVWKGNIAGIVIYSLLAALSFWFTATCIAIIGDAAGDRRVTGRVVKRWHFDAFLGFCLVIHAVFIVLFFVALGGLGLELAGIGMWLAILGVAWVAGWEPEFPAYQRAWPGNQA
nr:hypothetical protein B0A51_12320 [Rachicladosporium sp. CCFEE 5018]